MLSGTQQELTTKQKLAIKEMVENGGNVSQAMISAGYSPSTAHTPSKLTNSMGFKEYERFCAENGLSVELIIQTLVEDIINKPMARTGELLLASKLLGLLDRPKQRESGERFMPDPEKRKQSNDALDAIK